MALRALREIDLPSTLSERIVGRFGAAAEQYRSDEDSRDAQPHRPLRLLHRPDWGARAAFPGDPYGFPQTPNQVGGTRTASPQTTSF